MRFVTLIFLVSFFVNINAQNFTQAVGLRGGMSSGITYRIHANEMISHEFMLKLNPNELNFTVLREFHEENAFGYSPKLILNKGFGAHVGYRYTNFYNTMLRDITYSSKEFSPVIGFDAYIGFEYRIVEFPVIFGIDCKPFFEFSTRQIFRLYLPDIALAIKYRF